LPERSLAAPLGLLRVLMVLIIAAPLNSSALHHLAMDLVLVEDNAKAAQALVPALRTMGWRRVGF
jgi:hypothetical protein